MLLSHSPTFPACACLWALLIQTLTHGLASDLPVYHKCVSDMDFGMLLALILPWPVLFPRGGTIPSWWGPALLTWGIPEAACVSGSSQPFLCPDIILKKKKNTLYEFLWIEVGLSYSNFMMRDTCSPIRRALCCTILSTCSTCKTCLLGSSR